MTRGAAVCHSGAVFHGGAVQQSVPTFMPISHQTPIGRPRNAVERGTFPFLLAHQFGQLLAQALQHRPVTSERPSGQPRSAGGAWPLARYRFEERCSRYLESLGSRPSTSRFYMYRVGDLGSHTRATVTRPTDLPLRLWKRRIGSGGAIAVTKSATVTRPTDRPKPKPKPSPNPTHGGVCGTKVPTWRV